VPTEPSLEDLQQQNEDFYEKTARALRALFERAKTTNELEFAFSLSPEFRGLRGPGWNSAAEIVSSIDEYVAFINAQPRTRLSARVALGFYSNLSEAAGYYEIPKNMLRVANGLRYSMLPFGDLVDVHRRTGERIAPNANKVLRDLAGHAMTLGMEELAEVFRDAFDPDLRNGYAHADYVIWDDGIRLPKRNGGTPRRVPWPQFQALLEKGLNFFMILRSITDSHIRAYNPPRTIRGRLGDTAPEQEITIHCDPSNGIFRISGG
jgi:hypothetical protein